MSAEDKRAYLEARTDGELVRSLRVEGNTMAFEVLMRRYERPLFGFIVRQLGDKSLAHDLYQQTLLRVLDRIDTCSSPDAFKPWAFSVASNLCKNHRREQRAAGRPGELARIASSMPDPEQLALASETGRRIASALAALPDVQREVFVLYHYTQLSYDEIAVATGSPIGTVKSRMNAALVQLRSLLSALAEERP